MDNNFVILIPARRDSKGIPFKNRKLLDYTLDIIPDSCKPNIYVSTNDDYIINQCRKRNIKIHRRSEECASDEASSKNMVIEFIRDCFINKPIIMLYLTYPERTWDDVADAYRLFCEKKCYSLLCKKDIKTHPYLVLKENGEFKGTQIIPHNLCRRQDYPKVFEISHYISIIHPFYVRDLNMNLYNNDTIFFKINDTIDVDTIDDLNMIVDTTQKDIELIESTPDQFSSIREINLLDKVNDLPSNIGLCTICDNNFVIGAMNMIYSFLKNNAWFNGNISIIYNVDYSPLSDDNMKMLTSLYNKIVFINVNSKPYEQLIKKFIKSGKRHPNILRFIPSLFTFEIFEEVANYDTLLYLDADMTVINDLKELYLYDDEIIVTPDTCVYDLTKRADVFNGGFMVLKNSVKNYSYRDKLIQHAINMNNFILADQTIMNDYFNVSKLKMIDSRYNCLKRCYNDKNFSNFDKNIAVIHYVGTKPWHDESVKIGFESNYKKIESIWHKYNNEMIESIKSKNKRIAVFVHIFYSDVWAEIDSYLQNINEEFDLYVSTPSDNSEFISTITTKYPNVFVKYMNKNVGADVGPFIELVNYSISLKKNYDFILKLHTKKSLYSTWTGETWMTSLLESLVGKDNIDNILKLTHDDTNGMIGTSKYYMGLTTGDKRNGSPINKKNMDIMSKRLGIKDSELNFFAGTMFWMNYKVLTKYLNNTLSIDDFNEEHKPDGTMAHAMERLFACMVRDSNKKIIKI